MRTSTAVVLLSLLGAPMGCAGADEASQRNDSIAQGNAPDIQPAQGDLEFDEETNDPLEGLNRGVFEFNRVLDKVLIKPAAQVYRDVLPQEVQDSVRSFLRNLRSPIILANDVLQGDIDRAGTTVGRFLVNTTVGIGGLFDPAADLDMPFHNEDFGQTLGVWGVGEGFYLVLPILGPSNPRDAVGLGAEFFLDPLNIYLSNQDLDYLTYVRSVLEGIDLRARNIETLDELERTSLDYYAAIRSLYRQQRENEIRNSRSPDEPQAPSLSKAEPDDGVSSQR